MSELRDALDVLRRKIREYDELNLKAFDLERKIKELTEENERLKAQKFTHKNFGELVYVEDIDRNAKEMLEGIK